MFSRLPQIRNKPNLINYLISDQSKHDLKDFDYCYSDKNENIVEKIDYNLLYVLYALYVLLRTEKYTLHTFIQGIECSYTIQPPE